MKSLPINNSSPIKSILFAFFALVLAGSLAMPAPAQEVVSAEEVPVVFLGVWHTTIGAQHATLLRSRNDAIRETAMQNIIILASQHPGELDLTPTVPALLGIYANDRNRQHHIMAVAALRSVNHKYGMDRLYLLSTRKHRASKAYKLAQTAVGHYYVTQAMEHEMERAAHFTAKGDVKKAEKHTLAAAVHRGRLGGLKK